MINKSLFCSVLESIILQILKDREIGSYFLINSGATLQGTCTYDNTGVIKSCVKLLQEYFPKDEEGFCEIEHYLYESEFGKSLKESKEIETIEDLYKRLIKNL